MAWFTKDEIMDANLNIVALDIDCHVPVSCEWKKSSCHIQQWWGICKMHGGERRTLDPNAAQDSQYHRTKTDAVIKLWQLRHRKDDSSITSIKASEDQSL